MARPAAKKTKQGDLVLVTAAGFGWQGCVVVVDEVLSWGVVGFMRCPMQDGLVYGRFAWEDFDTTGGHVNIAPSEPAKGEAKDEVP